MEFYITSRDGKVAEIYAVEEWRRIEEKLTKLSNFNPSKKRFLNKVNYYGQMVEMDAQGRVLIPQILREYAAVKSDVAVAGNLTDLEVCGIEISEQHAREQFTAEEEKDHHELRIQLQTQTF